MEDIPIDKLEAIPSDMIHNGECMDPNIINKLPTNIHGSEELKNKLNALVERYRDRFRTIISNEPAKLPPFEIELNEAEWQIPSNRGPPRKMDRLREEEMRSQIKTLLDMGVLTESVATAYSQPLMVPKPNHKWRFCVDFKNLNRISKVERWPIPVIKDMLQRIGAKRPKFFAVLDLTSGYHQLLLSEKSRQRSAFITRDGIYEWCRLPMGLSGAPSFFQRSLSTIVLSGLMMTVCELYLDDLIIAAESEEELLEKLTKVLDRFRQYGLTINPDKCVLGKSSVTYVGHTINKDGMHFERDKLDSVLNFPKPSRQKEL
jgi:hypothetical protein